MKVIHENKNDKEKLLMIEMFIHSLFSLHVTYVDLERSINALMFCLGHHGTIEGYKIDFEPNSHLTVDVKPSKKSDYTQVASFSTAQPT
jgi:hypothetical protein